MTTKRFPHLDKPVASTLNIFGWFVWVATVGIADVVPRVLELVLFAIGGYLVWRPALGSRRTP